MVCIDVPAKTSNFRRQKDDKPIRVKKVPCGLWRYVQDCTPSTKIAKFINFCCSPSTTAKPAKTMKMAKFAKLEQDVPHGATKPTNCTKIIKITKNVMSYIFWMKMHKV